MDFHFKYPFSIGIKGIDLLRSCAEMAGKFYFFSFKKVGCVKINIFMLWEFRIATFIQ